MGYHLQSLSLQATSSNQSVLPRTKHSNSHSTQCLNKFVSCIRNPARPSCCGSTTSPASGNCYKHNLPSPQYLSTHMTPIKPSKLHTTYRNDVDHAARHEAAMQKIQQRQS